MIRIVFYVTLLIIYLVLAKGFAPSETNYSYFADSKALAQYLELEYPANVILIDMNTKGEFVKTYFHKYRVFVLDQYKDVEVRTSPLFFNKSARYLGMSLFQFTSEKQSNDIPSPSGVGFIGNEILGEWRINKAGKRYWQFYQFDSNYYDLLGWNQVATEEYYEKINSHQSLEKPYKGINKEFGLNGVATQKHFPKFYARLKSK